VSLLVYPTLSPISASVPLRLLLGLENQNVLVSVSRTTLVVAEKSLFAATVGNTFGLCTYTLENSEREDPRYGAQSESRDWIQQVRRRRRRMNPRMDPTTAPITVPFVGVVGEDAVGVEVAGLFPRAKMVV